MSGRSTGEAPGLATIRAHPRRPEAVAIAARAALQRWSLGDPPRIEATRAPHAWFGDVAVDPSGEVVAVATSARTVEFRLWGDLEIVSQIIWPPDELDDPDPSGDDVQALDLSPDGRWLAAADAHGGLHLLDRGAGRVVASAEAGERTDCLRFDASSNLLATACSSQGGGLVRIDRVAGGILEPVAELERAVPRPDWRRFFDWIGDAAALAAERHPPARPDFVDTLAHLAFAPDGRSLALFETSAIGHRSRRSGWRGDVVLFDAATWAVRWVASVDGLVTGDRRSLATAGHGMGFFTEVAFVDDVTVACGATRGLVLFYRVADGTLLRRARVHAEAPVVSLAVEPATRALWAALGPGGGPPGRVPDR